MLVARARHRSPDPVPAHDRSAAGGERPGRCAEVAGCAAFTAADVDREYAAGKHRVTDDSPYGGGAGMVMKPEPLVAAIEAARARLPGAKVFLMSPQGRRFDQEMARRSSFVGSRPSSWSAVGTRGSTSACCNSWTARSRSGDFILSGGEVAAFHLAIIDATARLIPGVLGNEASTRTESFMNGGLEYPQYTRPPEFRGLRVPEALKRRRN